MGLITVLVYTLQNLQECLSLVRRAKSINLESSRKKSGAATPTPKLEPASAIQQSDQVEGVQMSFFQLDDPALEGVRDKILDLDIDNLTPIEALMKLHEIRKTVGGN